MHPFSLCPSLILVQPDNLHPSKTKQSLHTTQKLNTLKRQGSCPAVGQVETVCDHSSSCHLCAGCFSPCPSGKTNSCDDPFHRLAQHGKASTWHGSHQSGNTLRYSVLLRSSSPQALAAVSAAAREQHRSPTALPPGCTKQNTVELVTTHLQRYPDNAKRPR